MINFYPGPSKLYPEIGSYLQEAFSSGILEMNHRSSSFMELFASTKNLLRQKLSIPPDYEIVLVSSATECWEIISQSFVGKESAHFYNGAFGEKWFQYAKNIRSNAKAIEFNVNELPEIEILDYNPELIALTHNETSNGTMLQESFLIALRNRCPDSIIAYDATSSMAGIDLHWQSGDIWFASVQKCFGLPPGLAVMVVSPKALEKARIINDSQFYNSFNYVLTNARKQQTHHTPNIANIFLLNRTLQNRASMERTELTLKDRKEDFLQQLSAFPQLRDFVKAKELQSTTVICLAAHEALVSKLKIKAKEHGIQLGNGYGDLKNSTIRLANFPAVSGEDFERLIIFFKDFFRDY